MLSSFARAAVSKGIAPLGRALVRAGVTPNVVTLVGTGGSVMTALVFFPAGHLLLGAVVCGVFALFDMLDGAVARASGGGTKFGAVLDASCDRIADGAIFGALAWWAAFGVFEHHDTSRYADYLPPSPSHGDRLLLCATLLSLVFAQVISYVKARAEASGLVADAGWIERPERLLIVLIGVALTGGGVFWAIHVAMWFLAAASAVTVGQRVVSAWRDAQRQDDTGQDDTGTSAAERLDELA